MNKLVKYILLLLLILFTIQLLLLGINGIFGIYKYFLLEELDLINRYKGYNDNPWVVITGASSGQGKNFAYEFAQRKFNLLLIGSNRIDKIKEELLILYPNIKINIIYKDFRKAYEDDFFDDIQIEFNKLNTNISLLINNTAYRTGWIPHHKMDSKLIRDTISGKPFVQTHLTKMIIPIFLERKNKNLKSCLINISAQCMHPNYLLGITTENEISVPYLSVYEASNAYCYYYTNSIYKEYKNDFDIMNITPGAVITDNTSFLKNTLFSVSSEKFVKNIMKMIGNVQGTTCGYWGHAFSPFLINIFPFIKDDILEEVGKSIAINYMNSKKSY
jgi:short-subunit dehydrogenase